VQSSIHFNSVFILFNPILLCEIDSSQSSDSSTDQWFDFDAAIAATDLLRPFLFENEEPDAKRQRGGSRKGKKGNIDRRREAHHHLFIQDYFSERPIYDHAFFRRRFRMRRELFLKILNDLGEKD
jgi:hypothetical protein